MSSNDLKDTNGYGHFLSSSSKLALLDLSIGFYSQLVDSEVLSKCTNLNPSLWPLEIGIASNLFLMEACYRFFLAMSKQSRQKIITTGNCLRALHRNLKRYFNLYAAGMN